VTVEEVDEEEETVSLSIGDEEITLEVGESEDVDTDGDGDVDTKVTLEGIENGEAELKFTEITDVKESDGGSPGFEAFGWGLSRVRSICPCSFFRSNTDAPWRKATLTFK